VSSDWPESVLDFEAFLEKACLVCQRCVYPRFFDNKTLDCRSASIAVRAESDRGRWSVEVADVAGRPERWYDAAILRDLLLAPGKDVLSLTEQIDIVEKNWPAIVACFGPTQRDDTHAQLAALKKERLKRILPGLFPRKD
jgi:hypothetical protein